MNSEVLKSSDDFFSFQWIVFAHLDLSFIQSVYKTVSAVQQLQDGFSLQEHKPHKTL